MQTDKMKIRKIFWEYLMLTAATLILVIGVYLFKFPNHFSFGGVTGIAIVLSAAMPATPGNITFIINILLLLLGFLFLGKDAGWKTVYVSVLTSVGLGVPTVMVSALFFCKDVETDTITERAQQIFDKLNMTLKAMQGSTSMSMGAALSDDGITFKQLYQTADQALYQSKKHGRERISFAFGNPAD